MDYLLYSSKEMFSSTDLIRKSKMIFDKINSDEISKAIILRDGKPSFIMLDFDKYESMMKEYQLLKSNKQDGEGTKQQSQNHIKPKEQILKGSSKEIITKEVVNFQDEEAQLLKTLNDLDDMEFEDIDEKELKSLDEFDDEVEDYDDESDEDLEDFEQEKKSKEQPLKDFWE